MIRSEDLLRALLDACLRGHVLQGEAAHLLGIRKADLGDLVAWRMIERGIWRLYESAFARAFPECNAALYQLDRVDPPPPLRTGWQPGPCQTYSATEAVGLPKAQGRLHSPMSNAARDFAEPGNDLG